MDRTAERQASYYTQTSADYDDARVSATDEHAIAPSLHVRVHRRLRLFERAGRRRWDGARRRMSLTTPSRDHGQGRRACAGTDRSSRDQALHRRRADRARQRRSAPFPERSFDVVCGTGVLHHVRDPEPGIAEMTRVARHAIFLSDMNRFGTGSLVAGGAKLLLWKLRIWRVVDRLETRGRGYRVGPSDGVSFLYSVDDSLKALSAWADRTFLVPTVPARSRTWFHPLLSADHVFSARSATSQRTGRSARRADELIELPRGAK